MQHVLFIFIDGIGIGPRAPELNPLAAFRPRVLRFFKESLGPLPLDGRCLPVDPQLGVEGLPQSATGQTALLTGINAASLLGRHLQGFPNQALRDLLKEHSLFLRLRNRGLDVAFANTYTPRFFTNRPRWISATTVMCETAGVKLGSLQDLLAGQSLFLDFTNRVLIEQGHAVPLRTAPEAAEILLNLSRRFHLCLYEYFITDLVGHRGDLKQAVELLKRLDSFLFALVKGIDQKDTSLVVTSDHGNIECMDRKQHTTNPVPLLVWGPLSRWLPEPAKNFSLMEITPLIEAFLSETNGKPSSAPSGPVTISTKPGG